MLRLTKAIRVIRDVNIKVPDTPKQQTIKVEFLVLDNKRLEELQAPLFLAAPERAEDESGDDFAARRAAHSKEVAKVPRNILREVITGWPDDAGIVDEEDKPIPFCPDALELLLSYEFAVSALIKSYRHLTNPKL